MPTTKTDKKKAARKATKPSRTTILENSVKHIHKRLDIHRDQIAALEKHLDILTRTSDVQAKEIVDLKLGDAKGKWVPKKGDWVAMSDDYPKTAHPWEEKVRQVGSCLGDRVLFGDEFGFYPLNCVRPATQTEIDAHLRAAREEEEAKKPVPFGTPVQRIKGGEKGLYWYQLLDGTHKIILDGGAFLTLDRSQFTVLNN